jgi:hypothetical protein
MLLKQNLFKNGKFLTIHQKEKLSIQLGECLKSNDLIIRMAKFNSVYDITIYIPANYGASKTRIYYIGLKGEYLGHKREAVLANYELKPQMKDHKAKEEFGSGSTIQ